ncbi:MAG: HAD family phosphatase [Deltaproteobacteria bacterium]|nr:HAD family phosphatase [Deltaproteobacteria bacterium]
MRGTHQGAVTVYLFDFNGVLVDDERVHFAAFREVLERRGVSLDEPTYLEKYFAFDDATGFRSMLRDAGKPHDDALVAECVAEKLPVYMRAVERDLVLFPGGFELVRACAARGAVGIVSGALRVEIDFALRRGGAADAVTTIVAAEDVTACKPDPAGYLEALRRLGASQRDAVVIEDSIGGVRAGCAAGCAVVAVAHSYAASALREAGARDVASHVRELDVERLEAARLDAARGGA